MGVNGKAVGVPTPACAATPPRRGLWPLGHALACDTIFAPSFFAHRGSRDPPPRVTDTGLTVRVPLPDGPVNLKEGFRATLPCSLPQPNAEALLQAVADHGDREAFAALFRFFAPRVKGYLLTLGAPAGVAEDLVQEVMLAVWRKADQFDPSRGAAAAWIFTASRNLFVSRIRREKRAQVEEDDPQRVSSEPGPEEHAAATQSRDALASAIASLPPEEAAVLNGAYFRGRTMRELAEDRGVPLGTVKTRVRLGLERLRRTLCNQTVRQTLES